MPFGLSRFLAAIILLAAMGSAFARNDQLMLPLDAALKVVQGSLRPDIELRFGKESAAAADPGMGTLEAHGVGDPYGPVNTNAGAARSKRTDLDACEDALRNALVELQAKARARGARAVVGIVGNYHGIVYDSTTQFECHAGNTRSVVDLRGQFAR